MMHCPTHAEPNGGGRSPGIGQVAGHDGGPTTAGSPADFNPHAVRVESARQRLGDARANPAGKVPDSVWDFPPGSPATRPSG